MFPVPHAYVHLYCFRLLSTLLLVSSSVPPYLLHHLFLICHSSIDHPSCPQIDRPTSSTSCLSGRPLSVTTFLTPPPLFVVPRLTDGDIQRYLITLYRPTLPSLYVRPSASVCFSVGIPLVASLHYIHTY